MCRFMGCYITSPTYQRIVEVFISLGNGSKFLSGTLKIDVEEEISIRLQRIMKLIRIWLVSEHNFYPLIFDGTIIIKQLRKVRKYGAFLLLFTDHPKNRFPCFCLKINGILKILVNFLICLGINQPKWPYFP